MNIEFPDCPLAVGCYRVDDRSFSSFRAAVFAAIDHSVTVEALATGGKVIATLNVCADPPTWHLVDPPKPATLTIPGYDCHHYEVDNEYKTLDEALVAVLRRGTGDWNILACDEGGKRIADLDLQKHPFTWRKQ